MSYNQDFSLNCQARDVAFDYRRNLASLDFELSGS